MSNSRRLVRMPWSMTLHANVTMSSAPSGSAGQ